MRRNIAAYESSQVFLNYPYDEEYQPFADALAFSVVAAGLVPVTAQELSSPDRPRLEIIFEAIQNCRYSLHDLSRSRGDGAENFARMNMSLELGMGLYHAMASQRSERRCA